MRPLTLFLASVCAACLTACLVFRDDYFFGSALTVARWPLAAALMLCAFRLRHRRAVAIACLGFAIAGLAQYLAVTAAHAEPAPLPDETATLKVVTHNVLFKGARPNESLEMLGESGADLIALQEVTPAWEASLDAELLARLPHKAARAHAGTHGYAVYSRYPVRDVVYLPNREGLPFAQCFTLALPGRELPVCNVHLASPAGALLKHGSARLRGLESNAEQRAEEWADLEAHFGSAKHRLALGDLNTMEVEPLYGRIATAWVDAYRETNRSPGPTWPNHFGKLMPFARIDYVLTSAELSPNSATVPRQSGSDHLAVVAELRLAAARP